VSPDDLVELRHLVDRYADAVDRKDAADLIGLFAADGVLQVGGDGAPVENRWVGAEVGRSLDVLGGFQHTFHHIGGAVFEPAGAEAGGRVHCLAHHYERTGNGPVDLVMMINYHDRYRRVDGSWLIARRRVAIEWTELHPAHPERRVRS
jgi:hypothetical protein